MEFSVSSWNKFLHFVGRALDSSKCAWYLIKWDFDSNDSPFTQSEQDELHITMHDGTRIQSTQLQPNRHPISRSNDPSRWRSICPNLNNKKENKQHK